MSGMMDPAVIHKQKHVSSKRKHRSCSVISLLNVVISLLLFALYCEQRLQTYYLKADFDKMQQEFQRDRDSTTQPEEKYEAPSPRKARSIHHGNHTHFCRKLQTCKKSVEMIQLASPKSTLQAATEIKLKAGIVTDWEKEYQSGQISAHGGKIVIKVAGHYYVFAQMMRTSQANRFSIMKNTKRIVTAVSKCLGCTQVLSRIIFLQPNDEIWVKAYANSLWWSSTEVMYLGMYLITPQ